MFFKRCLIEYLHRVFADIWHTIWLEILSKKLEFQLNFTCISNGTPDYYV